jgi:maleamate amidohydrolase
MILFDKRGQPLLRKRPWPEEIRMDEATEVRGQQVPPRGLEPLVGMTQSNAPALLVIDMLSDFLEQWPGPARKRLLDSTQELLTIMRNHGFSVIWVRQEFEADLSDAFPEMRLKQIRITMKGSPGSRIVPQLEVGAAEPVVVKKRYSAFFATKLDGLLAALQPEALILAGINTHACIRVTAIDAYQRDIPVVLAADCIDSYDREHHDISLRYMKNKIAQVMTNAEIAAMLSAKTRARKADS